MGKTTSSVKRRERTNYNVSGTKYKGFGIKAGIER
jgi:hypothetical protein